MKYKIHMLLIFTMVICVLHAAAMTEEELLAELNSAGGVAYMQNLVEANNDLLGINLSVYESLSNASKTSVYQVLINKSYISLAQFSDEFMTVVKKTKAESETKSGGGGGGGSSSSSITPVYNVNSAEPVDENGDILDTVTAGQNVKIAVSVSNLSVVQGNPTIVLGVYSGDNRLRQIFIDSERSIIGEDTVVTEFNCTASENDYVKAYVWENLNNIRPVSNTYKSVLVREPLENTIRVKGIITNAYDGMESGNVQMTVTQEYLDGAWTDCQKTVQVGAGMFAVADLLGRQIETYIQDISGTPLLVRKPRATDESSAWFSGGSITEADASQITIGGSVQSTFTLSNQLEIYHNLVRQSPGSISVSELKTRYPKAEILLVDNDDTDGFNVLYINDYYDGIVEDINAQTAAVTFEDGSFKVLNHIRIVKDGTVIPLTDIQKGDVLSISGGYDETGALVYGEVVVTSGMVRGIISSYYSDECVIIVRGCKYNCVPEIGLMLDNQSVVLGDTVEIRLNSRKTAIALFDDLRVNMRYGFAALVEFSGGIATSGQVKVLDADGNWSMMDFASSVYINGAGLSSLENVDWNTVIGYIGDSDSVLNSAEDAETRIINKPIAYVKNSDDEILRIWFVPTAGLYDAFSQRTLGAVYYADDLHTVGDVKCDGNTVVFDLYTKDPVTGKYAAPTDRPLSEGEVFCGGESLLANGCLYDGLLAYNIDRNGVAGVLYGKGLVNAVNNGGDFTIVSGGGSTSDSGDEGVLLPSDTPVGDEGTLLFVDNINIEDIKKQ